MDYIKEIEKYLHNTVPITSTDPDFDLTRAKALATGKVREIYPDAMLLAWYEGETGNYVPKSDCDFGDKPSWIVYAESRGADITMVVDDGRFVFLYNTEPQALA
jgi:Domain of unknown function (DUF5619)